VGHQYSLICILVEHQTSPDPVMPLRLLLYAVLHWEQEWRQWEQGHPRGEPLRLTPVIPIVVHTGLTPWTTNRSLADLFLEDPEVRVFVPEWPAHLWHLVEQDPAALLQAEESLWQALAVARAERAEPAEFRTIFAQLLSRLEGLAERDRVQWQAMVRMALYWALFRRPRSEHAALIAAARQSQQNGPLQEEVQAMSSQLEQTYEQELLARGQALGEARGEAWATLESHRSMLRRLVRERFETVPPELEQRIVSAELTALESAILQMVHVQSLDELRL
jgi:hypothetical protein